MAREKTRYKYGDYIIREIKGRYYVIGNHNMERENGEREDAL
ncbi:putative integrase [Sulfolobus acidocaldarius]